MSASDEPGFLARWARRKAEARRGVATTPSAPEAPATSAAQAVPPQPAATASHAAPHAAPAPPSPPATPAAPAPAPPTLDDVARLTRESDFSRYVAGDVEPGVRNAAMRKLFSDPHFNAMDGLDVYIDDYGKPDPLPPGMLRRLAQSHVLGLFDDEDSTEPAPTSPTAAAAESGTQPAPHDEDPDLRLQPDDAAGHEGGEPDRAGPREDPAGQR